MKKLLILFTTILLCSIFIAGNYYPIDGYNRTGIKRLKRLELIQSGDIESKLDLPKGAFQSYTGIALNLTSKQEVPLEEFLKENDLFQEEISRLFRGLDKSYSLAVLDISDLNDIKYASRNETAGYQPGSVGKLAVLVGLFNQLAKIYPDDFGKRLELLKSKRVKAGSWGLIDSHTIPIYDMESQKFSKRRVTESDVFSLFEWVDHMVSVSNNGAASIVWREVLLMQAFGANYPTLSPEEAAAYFKDTPRKELTDIGNDVVNLPLRDLGITEEEWRLGSFFTRGADKFVGSKGGSTGTPIGLMKFLIQLEQGKVVDAASSLEMKRLMYMTDRRIRYAKASALSEAAVYFKSGSLYKCDRSNGQSCGKYMGNVYNYMNSVAIVEHPDNCKYIVALMTNVLRKNSASDHMSLATKLDKIIRK